VKFILITCVALLSMSSICQADEDPHAHHREMVHYHGTSVEDMGGTHMKGMLGSYTMNREASGTSWQPESSPMEGFHFMAGDLMGMLHGFANVIHADQAGTRGGEKTFSQSMLMGMAQHPLGNATLGLRAMLSLDPLMGKRGYPLLLQTGETADGVNHLVDRQHPHDFFMELAGSLSVPVGEKNSLFLYGGLPGEPALGPPTFMHRFSGVDNPEAPILHHWLDSTHITFGVITAGLILDKVKLEGSIFNGREPNEERWDIETGELTSYAGRVTINPTMDWSLQGSFGYLESPEQLEPEVNIYRATASATYNRNWGEMNWQTTAAIGINAKDPGSTFPGALVESAVNIAKTHTFFGRAEAVRNDELFGETHPLHHDAFNVGKVTLGYIYDFPEWHNLQWGVGGAGSLALIPDDEVRDAYGQDFPLSWMVFARVKL
jgi:hypothetical protein